jgi:hypothetical protein
MDHFDRRLEIDLAHLLDPIVDAPVPRRHRQRGLRALTGGLSGLPLEMAIVAEPVPVVVAASVGTPS